MGDSARDPNGGMGDAAPGDATPPTAREAADDTLVGGRFRRIRQLGRGGMGSVWLAHHVALDVPCALKFIDEGVAERPDLRARFVREARAAAKIRSPNVVQVLDYGTFEGKPYIAMELLEGEDLAHRLDREGCLSLDATVAIVSDIARALGKAHDLGIVHRDLKPENVYLVPDRDREIAKVLDFGIAKHAATDPHAMTQAGSILGTPHYMSPEQARGAEVDARSDLWSLAVVTYRCLTGRLPFDAPALGQLFADILAGPIPVPSTLVPGLPKAFDGFWARAAARDPSARFGSADEMAQALAVALGVRPRGDTPVGPLDAPIPRVTPSDSGPARTSEVPYSTTLATPGASPLDLTRPSAATGSKAPRRAPWIAGLSVGLAALLVFAALLTGRPTESESVPSRTPADNPTPTSAPGPTAIEAAPEVELAKTAAPTAAPSALAPARPKPSATESDGASAKTPPRASSSAPARSSHSLEPGY